MFLQDEIDLRAELAAEESAEETKVETARKMLEDNMSAELVSKYTSLPLEKVFELKRESQAVKA